MLRLRYDDLASAVETRCADGHPQVLRCHGLRRAADGVAPFPTLFWLVCPSLVQQLARLEADGWIGRLRERVDRDPELHARLQAANRAYAAERWSALSARDQGELVAAGLAEPVRDRGIGGMRDVAAVKCLHLHYAHHLARTNPIGALIDELAPPVPCPATAAAAMGLPVAPPS